MVEEDPLNWANEPPENYKNHHLLYLGIHRDLWSQWSNLEKIHVNFFMTKHAIIGLSVDWSKYATPKDTLNHLKPFLKIYGIAEINVGELRNCRARNQLPLSIMHDPMRQPPNRNRAHTLLKGVTNKNKATVKRRLYKLFKWAPEMKPIIE